MNPRDIIFYRDDEFGHHRFYEVLSVCLGAVGQTSMIELRSLTETPGQDANGRTMPAMWVPEPLLRSAQVFTNPGMHARFEEMRHQAERRAIKAEDALHKMRAVADFVGHLDAGGCVVSGWAQDRDVPLDAQIAAMAEAIGYAKHEHRGHIACADAYPQGSPGRLKYMARAKSELSVIQALTAAEATLRSLAPQAGRQEPAQPVMEAGALSQGDKAVSAALGAEWTGKCRYCPARYSTAWELEAHERSHAESKPACDRLALLEQLVRDCRGEMDAWPAVGGSSMATIARIWNRLNGPQGRHAMGDDAQPSAPSSPPLSVPEMPNAPVRGCAAAGIGGGA